MNRYLKIPQYFGQATEVLYYNPSCQFESIEYYRKIKTIDGKKVLKLDGNLDYILAKFSANSGWFPQVGSSFFLKFMLPKDSGMYAKNFAVFGSGDMTDIANNDFWGLTVKTDPLTRTKLFYLTVSNTLQIVEIPFKGFTFSPDNFPEEVFNTIVLIQNANYAQLYVNGNFVSQANLPFIPETKNQYRNIYISSYGKTSEYPGMNAYIKELGLWERPIDSRDIEDLHNKNIVDNKGVTKKARRIKVDSGKFYYDGYIHSIDSTSLFIDGEGIETVYILIKESLITEEEDPELLDNSTNTYNLGKPGMHRIKYEYSYAINIDTATLPENVFAVKFLEFKDGVKIFSLLKDENINETPSTPGTTDTSSETGGKESQVPTTTKEILDLVSKYLFEMFGNFIFSGLSVSMQDKDQMTYQVSVGPGVYYLNGKRYEIEKDLLMDVSKNASLTSIVNEYIHIEPNKPILLSQQPVAGKYYINGVPTSGITRALAPIKQTKNIHVSRTDPNGEDHIDAAAIKVLHVYKGTSLETAAVIYKPCSVLDGTDGDYYFYNGKIKWSPSSVNKPKPAVNGTSVDTYVVEYVKYYNCLEGVDQDYVVIKGDRLQKDIILYNGKNITHVLGKNIEHIISVKITHNSSTYVFDPQDLVIRGNTFLIEKDFSYLSPGDNIEIYYSYNSDQNIKPQWHILFFNTPTKVIDTSVDGIVDYKYYLSDIYTLAIDVDNVFRLYRGIPGYRGQTIKTAIPESSLPIVDLLIDPDGSKYCKITSYDIYKTHVIDIRNLMKKVSTLETSLILSELEKLGESKATDITKLKGMFVDSLANYLRSDLSQDFNAFIDLVRERLYSGYDSTTTYLDINTLTGIKRGREVYYPYSTDKTKVIDRQSSYTSDEPVNKYLISRSGPQITIYNDFSYDIEHKTPFINKVLDSIRLSSIPVIPVNSEVSIMSSYIDESTITSDRSGVIKKILEKFKNFFESDQFTTVVDSKTFVVVGRGFLPDEKDISIKINNKKIHPSLIIEGSVERENDDHIIKINENGKIIKKIKTNHLKTLGGWSVTINNSIKANNNGEFVISINLPADYYIITGSPKLTISRATDPVEIETILNFSGIIDGLKNVINTGSRGNITFYDSQKFSTNYIPGIIQPLNTVNATVAEFSLYFSYIDFSSPIIIDICELEGNSISKILYRKFIKDISGFSKIVKDKYTIILNTPINLSDTKKYGIAISTSNSAIKIKSSEIGKPSKNKENLNVIVGKVNPLINVISSNSNTFTTAIDPKKGILYEIVSPDMSDLPKNLDGWIENIIYFDTKKFTEKQDRFSLSCDLEPYLGFDKRILVEYSTDSSSISNSNKKWNRVIPYMMMSPKEKFDTLSIRFILQTRNPHFAITIPQYPMLSVYKFRTESSYFSKVFDTSIETGTDDSYADIYLNSEVRADSSYSVKISPDTGMTWRDCQLIETKILGTTTYLTLKEEKYRYDCKLMPPVILEHEVIPYSAGSINNGQFDSTMHVTYLVSALDNPATSTTIHELYNVNKTTKLPEVYLVNNLTGMHQKIKLKITIDSGAKGFRIYRSINGAPLTQIYSSIATATVPGTLSISDIDPYRIPSNTIGEFPKKGILKINNELIKYGAILGNTFMVSDDGRGFMNTTVSTVRPGDRIDLFDFAEEHGTNVVGQMPKLYTTKKFFEFVDDNITYPIFSGRLAESEDKRHLNHTISYPKTFAIRIDFENGTDIKESSSIFNLICNIEKR